MGRAETGAWRVAVKLALASGTFVILALASGCATAIGGSQTTDDAGTVPAPDAAKDSGPVKKLPDAGNPSSDAATTADSSTPPDDSTCAAQTSKAQCEQCCLTVHPTGYSVYHTQLVGCACNSPAACATECQTELCNNQPTTSGDACETCITASLTQTGACYNAVSTACQGDVDCTALFSTCIPPCETK